MKTLKIQLAIICFIICALNGLAQSGVDQDQIRAYMTMAKEAEKADELDKALTYIQKAEKLLGRSTMEMENLRAWIFIITGNYDRANESIALLDKIRENRREINAPLAQKKGELIKYKHPLDGYGFMVKSTGYFWIRANYDWAEDFSEGLALVKQEDKYGYIDKNGVIVIPFIYESADSFSKGLARVEKDGMWGYINKKGEAIIPFEHDDLSLFSEGLAMADKEGKRGFFNREGVTIIPFEYDIDEELYIGFHEGLAVVKKGNKYGFINKKGEVIIPFVYKKANSFSEGLAPVLKGPSWGYINKRGEVVIPFQYHYAGVFLKGIAPVRNFVKDGKVYHNVMPEEAVNSLVYYHYAKWGFINREGKLVIPFKYEQAWGGINFGYWEATMDGEAYDPHIVR